MDHNEFKKNLPVLFAKPFALFPAPEGIEPSNNQFTYVGHDATHVKLQNAATQTEHILPLALVEFANPGVLRLMRAVTTYNGSFV